MIPSPIVPRTSGDRLCSFDDPDRTRQCRRWFAAVLLAGLNSAPAAATAACFGPGGRFNPDVFVPENATAAIVWLHRNKTASRQEIHFATTEAPTAGYGLVHTGSRIARAGVDFVSVEGTAVFEIGVDRVPVAIPLIDNGLLDGPRDFLLVSPDADPDVRLSDGDGGAVIRIDDNELDPAIDPLFVPEPGNLGYDATPLGNGRIRILTYGGWIVVAPDGSIDPALGPESPYLPLQYLDDGRILALEYPGGAAIPRLIRLNADGSVDRVFAVDGFDGTAVAQPDGRILVQTAIDPWTHYLRRIHSDGSPDTGFTPSDAIRQFALQIDGRILVLTRDAALRRLRSDGTLDPGFTLPQFPGPIAGFTLRADGTSAIGLGDREVVVDENGGLLPEASRPAWADYVDFSSEVVLNDGTHWVPWIDYSGTGTILRWDANGIFRDRSATIRRIAGICPLPRPIQIGESGPGFLYLWGQFTNVSGFPRSGLARLLVHPPERDFRVLTPAVFRADADTATVTVLRTGPSTNLATVSYRTADDSAKAGVDYEPRDGTLTFGPLEVSKTLAVPLRRNPAGGRRRSFRVELDSPSKGYACVPATPVHLSPETRLNMEVLRTASKTVTIAVTLHDAIPGMEYPVQVSPNLTDWTYWFSEFATGRSVRLPLSLPDRSRPDRCFLRLGKVRD